MRCIQLIILFQLVGLKAVSQNNYPVPVKDDRLLFYFQRSCNTNTIVYEINKLQNGNINNENPIFMHWILYDKGGISENLNFLQRRGFGLHSELIDSAKGNFLLHFYSYKKRPLYLLKIEGNYRMYININGALAVLNKLFIKCDNNALGIPIIIHYVEITGKDVKTGNLVTEKIKP